MGNVFGGVGNTVWEVNVGGCHREGSFNFFSLKSEFDHNFK